MQDIMFTLGFACLKCCITHLTWCAATLVHLTLCTAASVRHTLCTADPVQLKLYTALHCTAPCAGGCMSW